jgi:hypothetical protein
MKLTAGIAAALLTIAVAFGQFKFKAFHARARQADAAFAAAASAISGLGSQVCPDV